MIDFTYASDFQLIQLRTALIYYLENERIASPDRYSCIADMTRAINNEIEERGLV